MTPPYGPPVAPPPRSRGPVAVVGVALGLVLAVTLASFVVAHSGDSGPATGGALGGGLGGSTSGSNGNGTASGPLTVGGHPYVNACNVLPADTSNRILGTLSDSYLVLESYAENIRLAASAQYADVESSCSRGPTDEDRAAVSRVGLDVDNYLYSTDARRRVAEAEGGDLPGVTGGKLVTKDSTQLATVAVGNVTLRLEVQGAPGKGPVAASAVAAALRAITASAARPTSTAADIATPYRTSRGAPLAACTLMTTKDFEQVTRYSAETAQIERSYRVGPVDFPEQASNECTRNSASPPVGENLPPSPGTTYLRGGFGPTLEVSRYSSDAAAQKDLGDEYGNGQVLAGLGQQAYAMDLDGGVQLAIRQGDVLLLVRAIATVGTASWGRERYVTLLSGLARIALSRL